MKTSPRSPITLVAAAALAALTVTVPARALEPDALTVWVGPNRDVAALQGIGDRFEAELGIPVTVEVCIIVA